MRIFNVYWNFSLFVETITTHPEYKTVPSEMRHATRNKLQQAIPIAEELKAKLLEQYTKEHERYLKEKVS